MTRSSCIDVGTTQRAGRDRRRRAWPSSAHGRPAVPAVDAVPRPRRVRRRRAGARSCSTPPTRSSPPSTSRSTAVGITNQRASTVVWDRATGEPIGPALGWQDLRTVGRVHHGQGRRTTWRWRRTSRRPSCRGCSTTSTAPASATSASAPSTRWLAWSLTGGAVHVTDHTNAAVTGLLTADGSGWNDDVLDALGIPAGDAAGASSTRSGVVGDGDGAARRAADRRARRRPAGLARRPGLRHAGPGQDHVRHRRHARRVHAAPTAPASARRGDHGTFPIVAWSRGGDADVGRRGDHAVGRHERRVAARRPRRHRHAAPTATTSPPPSTTPTASIYVPALLGLGTPHWDYGARGTLRRPDQGHDERPPRAGRAGGRRPSRRRPRRGGRGRHRPGHRRRCASTAG